MNHTVRTSLIMLAAAWVGISACGHAFAAERLSGAATNTAGLDIGASTTPTVRNAVYSYTTFAPATRNFGGVPVVTQGSLLAVPAVYAAGAYGPPVGLAGYGYGLYHTWIYRPRYMYPYRYYPYRVGYSYYNPYIFNSWAYRGFGGWGYGGFRYPYSSYYQPGFGYNAYMPYAPSLGLYAPLGYPAPCSNYGGCFYW